MAAALLDCEGWQMTGEGEDQRLREDKMGDVSWARICLRDEGLTPIGSGGFPLDEIFLELERADMLFESGGVLLSTETGKEEQFSFAFDVNRPDKRL